MGDPHELPPQTSENKVRVLFLVLIPYRTCASNEDIYIRCYDKNSPEMHTRRHSPASGWLG